MRYCIKENQNSRIYKGFKIYRIFKKHYGISHFGTRIETFHSVRECYNFIDLVEVR